MYYKFFTISLGILLSFVPDFFLAEGFLNDTQQLVLRVLILMIFLWLTEVIPSSITALIPIIVTPFISQIELKDVLTSYSSSVVFLILGGFIIALGFEKSNLHQRIALSILNKFGNTKLKVILSISLLTASLSMLFSNTATCLLMLPIVKSIIDENFSNKTNSTFSNFLLLSIAYSASIGGMATPIGTIPNAIFIGFLDENYNIYIDFKNWLFLILPLVLFLLSIMMSYIFFRIEKPFERIETTNLKKNYLSLGNLTVKERQSFFIITFVSLFWIFKVKINDFFDINLTDSVIAIFGGLLFFIVPTKDGKATLNDLWYKEIPWNILILFGGGLAIASLIISSGLAEKLSSFLNIFSEFQLLTLILLITLFTSFLTEFTSNTATTFLLLPILSVFANENNINLIQILLPFILSASCAFMMPIATPPNAIIYSSNRFKINFMFINGFAMNLMAIFSIGLYVYFFGSFT